MSSSPIWISSTIKENKVEATGLKLIEVEVADEIAKSFTIPGQYVQMKLNDNKPGFYAIASPPSDSTNILSFLIKETDNNSWIANAKSGSKVDVSLAQGKGFNYAEYFEKYKFDYPATNILLMACGSGIAPIASAIESNTLNLLTTAYNSLQSRKAKLYIGARTESHLPFQSKYSEWESKGVTVIPVLSQPSNNWTGKKGYIQDALKEDKVSVPRNTGALLCGFRGMTDSVKETLLEAGVFEGRILLNF
jgi:NAD(P)H-flavin reductase